MIRVNLLKAEKKSIESLPPAPENEGAEKKAKERKFKAPSGNLIIAAAVVILGVLGLLQKNALDGERSLLEDARNEQRRLQPIVQKLDDIDWQRQILEKKVALIGQLQMQQGLAVRIADVVSRTLPEWVWLTETVYNRSGLQIKGRALSNVLISDYARNLSESGIFENVGIINTQQRNEGNNQFVEFSVSASFPAFPPAPAAKSAEAK